VKIEYEAPDRLIPGVAGVVRIVGAREKFELFVWEREGGNLRLGDVSRYRAIGPDSWLEVGKRVPLDEVGEVVAVLGQVAAVVARGLGASEVAGA
jgi:hypothetical protein